VLEQRQKGRAFGGIRNLIGYRGGLSAFGRDIRVDILTRQTRSGKQRD
jgi:hypothetical protein